MTRMKPRISQRLQRRETALEGPSKPRSSKAATRMDANVARATPIVSGGRNWNDEKSANNIVAVSNILRSLLRRLLGNRPGVGGCINELVRAALRLAVRIHAPHFVSFVRQPQLARGKPYRSEVPGQCPGRGLPALQQQN